MELSKMSEESLKAAGYDCLAAIENLQFQLQQINKELVKRGQEKAANLREAEVVK